MVVQNSTTPSNPEQVPAMPPPPPPNAKLFLVNELLCYVQNRIEHHKVEELAEVIASERSEDDIQHASVLLSRQNGDAWNEVYRKYMKKHKSNKPTETALTPSAIRSQQSEILVRAFKDMNKHHASTMPTFVAADLSKLPRDHFRNTLSDLSHSTSLIFDSLRRIENALDSKSKSNPQLNRILRDHGGMGNETESILGENSATSPYQKKKKSFSGMFNKKTDHDDRVHLAASDRSTVNDDKHSGGGTMERLRAKMHRAKKEEQEGRDEIDEVVKPKHMDRLKIKIGGNKDKSNTELDSPKSPANTEEQLSPKSEKWWKKGENFGEKFLNKVKHGNKNAEDDGNLVVNGEEQR